MSRISVIGLGKLGAPMAAVYASRGHDVIGLDLNEATVKSVNSGNAPVRETGLQVMMNHYPFKATTDYGDIRDTDITFVIVPTPSLESGRFTTDYVTDAVLEIGKVIADKESYHLVVICSTTMPGSIDGPIRAALEMASGKKLGASLGLCYSPEFIALGSVIENMLNPDMVLIGQSDDVAGSKLAELFSTVVSAPVRKMSIVNAEVAKIAINSYITMKISYANTIAEICEALPNGDATVVTDAIGMDSRIGSKYLKPGTAYGGPCFPRDTFAFEAMARTLGVKAELSAATQRVNVHQTDRLLKIIERVAPANSLVAILGVSYKPFTSVTEESPGLNLATALKEKGYGIRIFDPEVKAHMTDFSHSHTAKDAASGASVAVLMTAWPTFRDLVPHCFENNSRLVLIDCWDITQHTPWDETNIIRLGKQK